MKLIPITITIAMSAVVYLLMVSYISLDQNVKWVAPKSADSIQNPTVDQGASVKRGKSTYTNQCLVCHGAKGNGKGVAGAALSPKPSDFTSEEVQSQTDGAIYWKMTNGNPPMASYKDILDENTRWDLVNFIRTFKK